MLLETAHIIAADFAAKGYTKVQVYADVFVSMNGRKYQRLIDPSVNLASTEHGFKPKKWLLAPGRPTATSAPRPWERLD